MIFDLSLDSISQKLNCELAVVIPVYNESASIQTVCDEWVAKFSELNIDYLLILVNDGSKDDSLEKMQKINGNLAIVHKHNSGHGRSIRLGYDFALQKTSASFIMQIDSDGQCRPEFFDSFWQIRDQHHFILGKRETRGDGGARKVTSQLSAFFSSMLTGIRLADPNTPYRIIQNEALEDALSFIPESFDIHNIALSYVMAKKKYRIARPPIEFPERIGGENSINVLRVVQMGLGLLFDLYFLKKRL
ncbi:MAG: Undecaprenyl-phosphate 4-deoxy-4-formamido-L-arabinose transferase [Bacteroidetes bacterium MED-G17]|nr:MAG: Undecaprenyl-phosphate 4-deoxy-4-formamido-L-arabinose transferase [Bacteroidetes bacterium MED-G17]